MNATDHPRPARRRQGHAGRPHRRAPRDPGHLDRRHLPRQHQGRHRARRAGRGDHQVRRLRPRRDHQRDRRGPARLGRRRAGASSSTATRARRARSRPSTRCWRATATPSTPSLELDVDEDAIVERLLKRAETEGRADDTEDVIRERHGDLPQGDRAARRSIYEQHGVLVKVDGMGAVDEVTERVIAAPSSTHDRLSAAKVPRCSDAAPSSRAAPPSSSCSCGEAGLLVGQTLELLARRGPPGRDHAGARRAWPRTSSAPRRRPELPARPRLQRTPSARASTTRSSTASRGVRGCSARATSSRSTAAPSSRAGTATPPSRPSSAAATPAARRTSRLIDATEDEPLGRHRRDAGRRPPVCGRRRGRGEHRGRGASATGTSLRRSSRSTSATASARQMHDGPADPQLRRARQRARRSSTASPGPSSRWSPSAAARHQGARRRLDRRHRRRHRGPRTGSTRSPCPRPASRCSPPSTAAPPGSATPTPLSTADPPRTSEGCGPDQGHIPPAFAALPRARTGTGIEPEPESARHPPRQLTT